MLGRFLFIAAVLVVASASSCQTTRGPDTAEAPRCDFRSDARTLEAAFDRIESAPTAQDRARIIRERAADLRTLAQGAGAFEGDALRTVDCARVSAQAYGVLAELAGDDQAAARAARIRQAERGAGLCEIVRADASAAGRLDPRTCDLFNLYIEAGPSEADAYALHDLAERAQHRDENGALTHPIGLEDLSTARETMERLQAYVGNEWARIPRPAAGGANPGAADIRQQTLARISCVGIRAAPLFVAAGRDPALSEAADAVALARDAARAAVIADLRLPATPQEQAACAADAGADACSAERINTFEQACRAFAGDDD